MSATRDPVEDTIVDVLFEHHEIDEELVRQRWRAMPKDASLDARVLSLVGGNGVVYTAIMDALS